MKISTRGRYALRFMIDLAQHQNGEAVTLKDISRRQEISVKYLEQIVTLLNRGGLIRRFAPQVAAAGWDGITLDVPGYDDLVRIPTTHPDRGTRVLVGDILEGSQSVEDFLVRLTTA